MSSRADQRELIVVERFDAADGEPWARFVRWSGLEQLREVVSLDAFLCRRLGTATWAEAGTRPGPARALGELYWSTEEFLQHMPDRDRVQVLAVEREPETPCPPQASGGRFQFLGYDLIEEQSGLSALTNGAGGYPRAIDKTALSACGLLTDFERARQAQQDLLKTYPQDHHARCSLWGIWRLTS